MFSDKSFKSFKYAKISNHEYSLIIEKSYDKLYNFALKQMKNSNNAADIVQETFLKGYINYQNLKNKNAAQSWLFSICNNEISSFYRKENRYDSYGDLVRLENLMTYKNANFNKINIIREIEQCKDIDCKYKNLLILKYVADFRIKEICILTGLDEKVVKSRLFDGRKIAKNFFPLKDFKEEYSFTGPDNDERRYVVMKMIKMLEQGGKIVPAMSLYC